jgi:hypothetical protein
MTVPNEWFVAVFQCPLSEIKNTLVEFYRFIDELKGVQSLHFLIRDRLDGEAVFSFRVKVEPKLKKNVKVKAADKLSSLLAVGKFAIDPAGENEFAEYVAWCPEKRIVELGEKKFCHFIDLLKSLSAIVVDMVELNYFASSERVELAHIMSWMLGCTEYGLLSTTGMEIGYYDRLADKYCSYVRENFANENKKPN